MNNTPSSTVEEAASQRTQVAGNASLARIKDKFLLLAVIGVCVMVSIIGFLPKHSAKPLISQTEKEDTSAALKQNMAYIAGLRVPQKELDALAANQGSHQLQPILTKEMLARMNAPSTFFSRAANESLKMKNPETKTLTGQDGNAAFLNQQNDITAVTAHQLPHPAFTVPAGEMIPATLETAVHSELAGMVRAITTRDIYALSGGRLLIPKGSTLIGQFNTGISQGQSRIFVVWNRIQMSNGVIAALQSPSTDPIGRAGQAADDIDRHFFSRFGSGALLSVFGVFTANAGVSGHDGYNSRSQYRSMIGNNFQEAANQTLQQDMLTRPTLQVFQGTSINVFVAHDVDFYRVANRIAK